MTIETDYPDNVQLQESSLLIKFEDDGEYTVVVKVYDGEYIAEQSLQVSVLHVDKVDPTDFDGDGMPNTWEEKYRLDPNDPSDADIDLDSDKLSNLYEYNIGTNPRLYDTDSDGINDQLDTYPTDPDKPASAETPDDLTENIYVMAGIIIIILVVIFLGVAYSFLVKNKSRRIKKPFDDDEFIRTVRDEIIAGEGDSTSIILDSELWDNLESRYQKGEISEETYRVMEQELSRSRRG